MYRSFSLLICFALISCSSPNRSVRLDFNIEQSKNVFDKEFPASWPPKKIKEPLSNQQNLALRNMTKSVSIFLLKNKINFTKVSEFKLQIEDKGLSQLNKVSRDLGKSNIRLAYDALYFAKNPFSAGTFDQTNRELILSHTALFNEDKLNSILNHELVHVETYKKKLRKESSPFHCRFIGKQFAPHYLSCDEMNAYKKDIQSILSNSKNKSIVIKSKLQPAFMHTSPIAQLINSLSYDKILVVDGTVKVEGRNQNGQYWMEFPDFSTNGFSSKKAYIESVKKESISIMTFLEKIKETL